MVNRRGEIIASAITNLDLHDLGRLACTYGIARCYIVTPLRDQRALAADLIAHWRMGVGRRVLPERSLALERLHLVTDLADARAELAAAWGVEARMWATSAAAPPDALSHDRARQLLASGVPTLLVLGTAWGLAPTVLAQADAVLESIPGVHGYNHLSVRCAAAVLVDRLAGKA